jgi:hypothetical protein
MKRELLMDIIRWIDENDLQDSEAAVKGMQQEMSPEDI